MNARLLVGAVSLAVSFGIAATAVPAHAQNVIVGCAQTYYDEIKAGNDIVDATFHYKDCL